MANHHNNQPQQDEHEMRRSGELERREAVANYVTVKSQINLIRRVAFAEIAFGIIILFGQTVTIASSHEFATRCLTGIWTSWFFLISAGICLFWSTRCTFNGLLAVLVFQIISATLGIPLFTSSCVLFGVYPFKWSLTNGLGGALIGSSIAILTTNLIMVFCSIVQMGLNGYNAYNCYFLAYGEAKEDQYEYDEEDGRQNGGKFNQGNRSNSCNTSRPSSNGNNQQGKGPNQSKSVAFRPNSQNRNNGYNSNQRGSTYNANSSNQNQNSTNNDDDCGAGDNNGGDNNGGNNYNNGSNYNNSSSFNQTNNDDDWGSGDTSTTPANSNMNQNQRQQPTNAQKVQGNYGNAKYSSKTQKTIIIPSKIPKVHYDDPSMPQPPPDLTLAETDILIIKHCGFTGVIFSFVIFCCQTAMLALVSETGVNIGVGIWGALYYMATGVITVYNGLKPTAQSSVAIFILQTIQFVLSIPLVGIAYYILAVFGSCMQFAPVPECPQNLAAGVSVMCLAGVMAISGTILGLTALVLMLICSQAVCGIRCMVSGATVHPTL